MDWGLELGESAGSGVGRPTPCTHGRRGERIAGGSIWLGGRILAVLAAVALLLLLWRWL